MFLGYTALLGIAPEKSVDQIFAKNICCLEKSVLSVVHI